MKKQSEEFIRLLKAEDSDLYSRWLCFLFGGVLTAGERDRIYCIAERVRREVK